MSELLKMDTSSGIIPYTYHRVTFCKELPIKYVQAFIRGKYDICLVIVKLFDLNGYLWFSYYYEPLCSVFVSVKSQNKWIINSNLNSLEK